MSVDVVMLRDALGVGRDVPLNYVSRANVDEKFIESLTRDKHVVIFGSSEAGQNDAEAALPPRGGLYRCKLSEYYVPGGPARCWRDEIGLSITTAT
jgi:hypothetical protein